VKEEEVTIVPEEGLHARPAAEFVKAAKEYNSDIKVVKDGNEANAKSSLNLMSLGATKGDKLVIRAEGEDEEAAVERLSSLITEAT
jgi:phosphotransferase system HPr (HPr) family protein